MRRASFQKIAKFLPSFASAFLAGRIDAGKLVHPLDRRDSVLAIQIVEPDVEKIALKGGATFTREDGGSGFIEKASGNYLLTFNGPQVAEPLQRRAPDWEKLTGGHVNVVAVGFQTIYDKALLDASTKTNSFDAYVFDPQWMGDFTGPGYLLDLTDRVNSDPQLNWQDIGPFFRDFNATYNGKVYTVPLDGDFHMVYYRTDLIQDPPKTWDEFIETSKKIQSPPRLYAFGPVTVKGYVDRVVVVARGQIVASRARCKPARMSRSIPGVILARAIVPAPP